MLRGLLSLHPSPRYLEIGVRAGERFHAVEAARKVPVDPVFQFNTGKAREKYPESSYHQVTSDTYFGRIADPSDKFDVISVPAFRLLAPPDPRRAARGSRGRRPPDELIRTGIGPPGMNGTGAAPAGFSARPITGHRIPVMADETHKLQKDPPEGSREVVEHELKRQSRQPGSTSSGKPGRGNAARPGRNAKAGPGASR